MLKVELLSEDDRIPVEVILINSDDLEHIHRFQVRGDVRLVCVGWAVRTVVSSA